MATSTKKKVARGQVWRRKEDGAFVRVERLDTKKGIAYVTVRLSEVGRFSSLTEPVKVSFFRLPKFELWRDVE
jgi:hypothetical protein